MGWYPNASRVVECKNGAGFAINGRVVGLECFGYQQTFSKFRPKLVQSYALDVLDGLDEPEKTQISSESVKHFLEGVRNAPGNTYPSLGLGENIRFENESVSGPARCLAGELRTYQLSGIVLIKVTVSVFIFTDFHRKKEGII